MKTLTFDKIPTTKTINSKTLRKGENVMKKLISLTLALIMMMSLAITASATTTLEVELRDSFTLQQGFDHLKANGFAASESWHRVNDAHATLAVTTARSLVIGSSWDVYITSGGNKSKVLTNTTVSLKANDVIEFWKVGVVTPESGRFEVATADTIAKLYANIKNAGVLTNAGWNGKQEDTGHYNVQFARAAATRIDFSGLNGHVRVFRIRDDVKTQRVATGFVTVQGGDVLEIWPFTPAPTNKVEVRITDSMTRDQARTVIANLGNHILGDIISDTGRFAFTVNGPIRIASIGSSWDIYVKRGDTNHGPYSTGVALNLRAGDIVEIWKVGVTLPSAGRWVIPAASSKEALYNSMLELLDPSSGRDANTGHLNLLFRRGVVAEIDVTGRSAFLIRAGSSTSTRVTGVVTVYGGDRLEFWPTW